MGEEKSKKPRKSYVSEIDISTLLHRYTAPTLLALLQEVAHVKDAKIDWNLLVKKTATGITNPREYQMLWRHVAYGDALLDKVDGVSQPLDDDSDIECELEAFPPASADSLAEATACVKVLIASGVSNDPPGSTAEAPLTINMPKGQVAKGHDISVSSVQKQPQLPSVVSAEGLDPNGAANANARRKRKQWTDAEDAKLIAAVHKRSDISWPHISKTEFDGDRTPSMLAQRWAVIKKRGIQTSGNIVQPTEAQLATRIAMAMALDKNSSGNFLKSPSNVPVTNGNLAQPCAAEAPSASTSLPATQATQPNSGLASSALPSVPAAQATQPNSGLASSALTSVPATQATHHNSGLVAGQQHSGSSNLQVAATKMPVKKPKISPDSMVKAIESSNPQVAAAKMAVKKPKLSPDSMVKAAAVAAGARIATPSDAASLLKAAQSKNAVHIMPGSSLPKSSLPGTSSSLPSNVHFIRRTGQGVGPKPHPAPPTKVASTPSTKPATAAIQPRLPTSAPESIEVKTAEDSATYSPAKAEKKQPQEADLKFRERAKGDQIPSQVKSLKKAQLEGGPTLVKATKEKILGEVTNKGSETVKPEEKKCEKKEVRPEEKKCEKKEVRPEQPVAMDIDDEGEDEKQKPQKQPDGEEEENSKN